MLSWYPHIDQRRELRVFAERGVGANLPRKDGPRRLRAWQIATHATISRIHNYTRALGGRDENCCAHTRTDVLLCRSRECAPARCKGCGFSRSIRQALASCHSRSRVCTSIPRSSSHRTAPAFFACRRSQSGCHECTHVVPDGVMLTRSCERFDNLARADLSLCILRLRCVKACVDGASVTQDTVKVFVRRSFWGTLVCQNSCASTTTAADCADERASALHARSSLLRTDGRIRAHSWPPLAAASWDLADSHLHSGSRKPTSRC